MKTDELRLTPRRAIFRESLIAYLVIGVPVLVVLYLITSSSGAWRGVLVAQIVAMGVSGIAIAGYFRVAIWVGDFGIRERSFLTRARTVPRAAVTSALLVNTFAANGTDTVPQLFMLDADGGRLLRMQGIFWTRESMQVVLDHFPVPVTEVTEAVSIEDLRADNPALLYWFERYPVFAGVAFAAAAGVVGLLIVLLLHTFGVPVLSASPA